MCTCEKKTTIYENTSISKSTSLMGLQCTVGHHKKLPPPTILPRLPPRFYGFLPDKKNILESFPWEKYRTDDLYKAIYGYFLTINSRISDKVQQRKNERYGNLHQ